MKPRRKQSGVALVITLIMLSVITIIAVAFLALSQRERASTTQSLTGTEAELMASTGLERAKSHALAEVAAFLSSNAVGSRLLARPVGTDLAVSKAYVTNDTLFTNLWTAMGNSDYQALTNLIYDPQVPVFTTNNSNGTFELVDYLDLNRNGKFDPTGFIDETDVNGNTTGQQVFVTGDPQWIGVLARPNEPHSSSNRFIGRYAYIILPAGRTLDINFIHNKGKANPNAVFPYLRSQGHGSWEINLAAFLADLNNNNAPQYGWGGNFSYTDRLDTGASGIAFQHAANLLNFRYAAGPLWPARNVFGDYATNFHADGIDQFANGWIGENDSADDAWPGSPNPQQFFSVHDLLNPQTPSIQQFQDRLRAAGNEPDTYNAYTFYRMLAQLGTDSAPEPMQVRRDSRGRFNSARINVNYDNLEPLAAVDFTEWTAESFFHTAADKLLQEYEFRVNNNANVPLSVTNLPIYPTNHYTPAVHRILQMTLNIFEATTTNHGTYPYYPTALKPMFESQNGGNEVKIVGYVRVPRGNWAITNALNWKDLSNATDRASLNPTTTNQFVYGAPVLIGARKGFPNFNEYVFQPIAQVQRKLQFEKRPGSIATTNQAFFLGVSNVIALEAWNSYGTNYPRDIIIAAGAEVGTGLTNNEGFSYQSTLNEFDGFSTNIVPANTWLAGQYRIPLALTPQQSPRRAWTNQNFLPYSIYSSRLKTFVPTNSILLGLEQGIFPDTQWVLTTTNRLRFFMFDNGNLIDAVALTPQISVFNITKELHDEGRGNLNNPTPSTVVQKEFLYWKTNRWNNGPQNDVRWVTTGVQRQILESLNPNRGGFSSPEARGFRDFLDRLPTADVYTNNWAPYSPELKVYKEFTWEANDPLVHHIAEDLRLDTNAPVDFSDITEPGKSSDAIAQKIGMRNRAHRPWKDLAQPNKIPAIADPNVDQSDDWDFPTNKLATIGMLGRIHRGTPWQTIYLKSDRPDDTVWEKIHLGRARSNPTNDWKVADVFTVAQHPNASRGRLSVNQTNVAAWSALLSGVEVPTLQGAGVVTNIIEPGAIDANKTIDRLVERINVRRGQMTGQVFSSISELLSVKGLTVESPFLQPPYVPNPPPMAQTPLRDQHFEAIPEKILSLVHRGEPRFVVYAFGQSLKPAPQSILTSNIRGLVTNYEVTGEMASRAVMRVELDQSNNRVSPRIIVESFNIMPPD
jgi:hypothetical protein